MCFMVIGITLRQAKQTYDGVNWVEQACIKHYSRFSGGIGTRFDCENILHCNVNSLLMKLL